jgi:hypothetical protein
LAVRAVVGFIVGVADALNFVAAAWAGLAIASVNGHVWSKRGHFFWEICGGFGAEFFDPERKRVARSGEECLPLGRLQFVCDRDGREFGGVEDFVGVGVADPAENARIGERAFESAIFGGERGAKGIEIGGENFQATGIDGAETVFTNEKMQRCAMLGAGFGEDQRAVGKIEGGKIVTTCELCVLRTPVQAAGNHQMKHNPEIVIEADGDAFADTAKFADSEAVDSGDGRLRGAEKEQASDADVVEGLVEDARFEGGEVGDDVGKFGHGIENTPGRKEESICGVRSVADVTFSEHGGIEEGSIRLRSPAAPKAARRKKAGSLRSGRRAWVGGGRW